MSHAALEGMMGACIYCGQPAGILSSKHPVCQDKHDNSIRQITNAASVGLKGAGSLVPLKSTISTLANGGLVSETEVRSTLASVWSDVVNEYLNDKLIDLGEEQRLSSFQQLFGLSQGELNISGSYTRVAQSGVLRDLAQGKLPTRISVAGGLPINLQKGEAVVWAFRNVEMLEDKTRREYIGRSQGMSFRLMKGVNYRIGAFKGTPIDKTERLSVDNGMMVITDKNVYFAGPIRSIRVPFDKIVAFHPYDNGVGIMKDAANAKAQVFITGDGWFAYNLLTSVASMI